MFHPMAEVNARQRLAHVVSAASRGPGALGSTDRGHWRHAVALGCSAARVT